MTGRDEEGAWSDLADGEVLLSDGEELLWRQASPSFLLDGDKVSSQVFRPTRKDAGMLSTSRASVQTARDAYRFHTGELGLSSVGVLGVTVDEVAAAGSRAIDDSKAPDEPPAPRPPGHAYLDFRPFGGSRIKRVGASLLDAAMRRGWQQGPRLDGAMPS